ncbi:hypothetical protein [Desulfosporosinus sp.]|uniref:rolling circle replication-associated protein n=1 Tax=Desulfosporosinus sp. TaxID=157907 RepID=UPI0025C2522E|nr:hypothetical protein [Desulfosporosinus sp.]MBC2723729.1 hypothetical protein [Desulfosporosinus sp.]MBC2727378.1 hypothetical protein [Desulfosporosinus sp.]
MYPTFSLSDFKVIISGPSIEVFEFEKGLRHGYQGRGGRPRNVSTPNAHQRRQTLSKARTRIERLSFANFNTHDKFITLTFAETPLSLKQANTDFKHFIQKLRYRFRNFRYLAVLQFQDKNDRGTVHYHLLTDLPYIDQVELAALWGHGFVKINSIRHVENVGEYVTSHLTDDPFDARLHGHKIFFTSRNLKKPVIVRGIEAKEIADALKTKKEVSAMYYHSEYFGKINITKFNLNSLGIETLEA